VTFTISIRNPRAGWIDVDLRLGEQSFQLAVSHVANDPVRELAELALFIARGEPGRARVTFWLEPAGYELSASRDRDLKLALSHSNDAFRTLFDPALVLEQRVEPSASAAEILNCLRAARSIFAAAVVADRDSWSHPFPESLVSQLETALSA
jgi:hypothetical protein